MIKSIKSILKRVLKRKIAATRKPYGQEIPPFFNELTSDFQVIKAEWTEFVKNNNIKGVAIDDISAAQSELNKDKKWKTLFLYGYSYYNHSLITQFPVLFNFISRNEKSINLAMISTTEAGKHIPAHKGNNHGVLRLQLGLEIQEPRQSALRIEDKKVYLEENELFVFDDTFEHELCNKSGTDRTVLIIDFFKPLPFMYDKINRMQIAEMRKSDYVQSVIQKI